MFEVQEITKQYNTDTAVYKLIFLPTQEKSMASSDPMKSWNGKHELTMW